MAPKKTKGIKVEAHIEPPAVSEDAVKEAENRLKDKAVLEKCRQSMYYQLRVDGAKEKYDNSPITIKKDYGLRWAASQLGNMKIFGNHVHTTENGNAHSIRQKKKKKWRSKHFMITDLGKEKAIPKIEVLDKID